MDLLSHFFRTKLIRLPQVEQKNGQNDVNNTIE